MKILTKQYKSFENKVSFIGLILIAILGLVFLLGIVNPIKIPDKNEFITISGKIRNIKESKFSVLIGIESPKINRELSYLKRSGDWKLLIANLNERIGETLDFVCSKNQIYFRTPENEESCFVFEIRDQNKLVIELNQTIEATSNLNYYFFIFGGILFFYGSLRIYLRLK